MIDADKKLRASDHPNIRMFLSYSPVGDLNKLKVLPQQDVFGALLSDVGLWHVSDSISSIVQGNGRVIGLPSVKTFGYVFGSLPDISGKPQPYLYGLVYDQHGSAQGSPDASPIGAAAAYPLGWWKPNDKGVVELPVQRAVFDKSGQLIIWRCNGSKAAWVEAVSWPGIGPQPDQQPSDLRGILGAWSESWAGFTHRGNIHITSVDGKLKVSIDPAGKYTLTVWDEKFENGVLSFRVRGGAYGWKYLYTARPTRRSRYTATSETDRMDLTVVGKAYMSEQNFEGELFR